MFRGANGQKDLFRKNPDAPEAAHIKFLDTARGTKLMVSGWWGLARHINYTGDWMMAWAWCLPCGARREVDPCAARRGRFPGAMQVHASEPELSGYARAGFRSVVPYFYVIYFGTLLVHREMCARRPPLTCYALAAGSVEHDAAGMNPCVVSPLRRDEEACRAKYGKDWDRYCAKVKYRFFPGVY